MHGERHAGQPTVVSYVRGICYHGLCPMQEDLYKAAGISELVQAAASGYHATVFAYGQTGSGKTHTMEGFKYVSPGFTPVASSSKAAPHADFDATPPTQLGIVPRAVTALFDILRKSASTRRATVRVSCVQLYKEQAYDLLNPTPLALGTRPPKPGAYSNSQGCATVHA